MTEVIKKAKTWPKNLTQPILVRKSYRYRGIQPLITIKNIRQSVIFNVIMIVKSEKKTYKLVDVNGVQKFTITNSSVKTEIHEIKSKLFKETHFNYLRT